MTQDKALEILQSGANVFLTGEPGSGKSYTINRFTAWMKEQHIPYAITASTGIAATHIGGTTIHSWSGIGIKEEVSEAFIDNIIHNKPFVTKKILYPRVLIIDEISMLNAQTLDNVERIISAVRNSSNWGSEDKPFGGLQIVFVGDFFQLPPVSKFGKETKFAFESAMWHAAGLTYCYLHEQHRQSDPVFLEILTAIRQGEVTDVHKKILSESFTGNAEEITTRLFTHNIDVDRINTLKLAEIKTPQKIYIMTTEGNEYLCDVMKKNCLSPERLVLKVGAVVMFTRNKYDEDSGKPIYVNGTLGKVTAMNEDAVVVQGVDGRHLVAEEAEWSIEEHGVVRASVRQIPLKLAWAVTVHKSQGMSLDQARIDLSKAFEYGQGYVALSRVRTMQALSLEGINPKAFEMHPKVIAVDDIFREASDSIV